MDWFWMVSAMEHELDTYIYLLQKWFYFEMANMNSFLGLSFNDLSTSPRLAYTQDNNGVSFTSIEPGQLLLLCKICMCHSFTTK